MTPRQRDVIALFANGFTHQEAAWILGVSFHTIKSHATHIRQTLGAHNEAHAVALAMRGGWLT
jgi:DNA-binding CsgD family transcriptional regulator